MPELPEVEVVRRGVAEHVVGRTLGAVTVHHPRAVRRHAAGADDFTSRSAGLRVVDACRRGKYLWLPLEAVECGDQPSGDLRGGAGQALLIHLGMSGQLLVRPPEAPAEGHLRVRFAFLDSGPELRFVDQRTFGGMSVEVLVPDRDGSAVPRPIVHIARDPLDPGFDPAVFTTGVRRRRTGLKRALLDQSLISGIGNIYADEALWRARLHYARPTETMRHSELARVLDAAVAVMSEALGQGGTSFDRLYVDVNGRSGYFDRSLAVYGRAGSPCRRCGATIRRDPFMNRSSFTCAVCQPRPRRCR